MNLALDSLSPDGRGVVIAEIAGRVITANTTARARYGVLPGHNIWAAEVLGLAPEPPSPDWIGREWHGDCTDASGQRVPVELVFSEINLDGRDCVVLTIQADSALASFDWGDDFPEFGGLARASDQLRISREFLKGIFETSQIGMALCNRDGLYVRVNQAFCDFLGYTPEELLSMRYHDVTHPDDLASNVDARDDLLEGGRDTFQMEKRYVRKDGRSVWALMVVSVIRGRGRRAVMSIGQMLDIDNLKRTEAALLHSKRALRALSSHQDAHLEMERKHIAQEIHDEMGQLLTAIKMDIALLRGHVAHCPAANTLLESMRDLADQAIRVVRQIASRLRPSALDLGIVPALDWLVRDFSRRYGIDCRLELDREDFELDDARATAVFRVVQESLTNVARHAQASTVLISLECVDRTFCVSIADDGCGFEACAGEDEGFGVLGMRERALALGGVFSLASAPGTGTRVSIELPIFRECA